ncbi:MAG: SGNH/GDSL hydrolase family protein [Bdellovibrionota bacterium]
MSTKKKILFGSLSALLGLVVAEVFLALVSLVYPLDSVLLLHRFAAESPYYFSLKEVPTEDSNQDPLLGWRNKGADGISYNGWRQDKEPTLHGRKRRLAFAGDSFVFGVGLGNHETLPYYLQKKLGPEFEVLNFGVQGFGIDQTALVTAHILPAYHPERIIFGFIADDLDRSCTDFSFQFKKPYFKQLANGLSLEGVPAKSRRETYLERQDLFSWLNDGVKTLLSHSRVYALGAQVPLTIQRKHCREKLGPAILAEAVAQAPAPVLLLHLDGKLPQGFEQALQQLNLNFVSAVDALPTLAAEYGYTLDRQDDGHPKAGMNRAYAQFIYDQLQKENRTASRK